MKPGVGSPYAIRGAISFIIVGVFVLALGCQDVRTISSAEARSPDGNWLATARTIQHSGPGTAGLESGVYLKSTNDSSPALEILGFYHRQDSQSSSTINLTMQWVSPMHLDVTYDGRAASLEFQAVKFDGVEISVRDLSSKTDTSQK